MSIKVNPNILTCTNIDAIKKLTVSQGCYCFPGKQCTNVIKMVGTKKTKVPGKKYDTHECSKELIQFRLDDTRLYFATGRIAVIVIRHGILKTKKERPQDTDEFTSDITYPFHYVWEKPSSKKVPQEKKVRSSKVSQGDIKLIYNLFSHGYTPLLLFLDDPNSLEFMERAQLTKTALSYNSDKKLVGLPMNGKDFFFEGKEEDVEENEDVASLKQLFTSNKKQLSGKAIAPSSFVDPSGDNRLKVIARKEKADLGGSNLNSLLHTSSPAAVAAYTNQAPRTYNIGTNDDLRTFEEFKAISSSWQAGMSSYEGGETMWADITLVQASIRVTGIAPILFDSEIFENSQGCGTYGLRILSGIISSAIEYNNPEDPTKVLRFTLLNFTGRHYNGIKFKYRDSSDIVEEEASDEELRWRSVSPDFKSLPDTLKASIYLNLFLFTMKNRSTTKVVNTHVPTYNKEGITNGVYTDFLLKTMPLTPDGVAEYVESLDHDFNPSDWLRVIETLDSGAPMTELIQELEPATVMLIKNSKKNYLLYRVQNGMMYLLPRIVFDYLGKKLELIGGRPTLTRMLVLIEEPNVRDDIRQYIGEIDTVPCPLSINKFSLIRADATDPIVTIKMLARKFFEEVIVSGIKKHGIYLGTEYDDEKALKIWCDMTIDERIEYYRIHILWPVYYPQIPEEVNNEIEGEELGEDEIMVEEYIEDEDDIDERIVREFLGCNDSMTDEGWVGRYLNQPGFYKVVASPGDGNCFFWSIAQALFFEDNNEMVDEDDEDEERRAKWEILSQTLRRDSGRVLTHRDYNEMVNAYDGYRNWRAARSLTVLNAFLTQKIERIQRRDGSTEKAYTRFQTISTFLTSLDHSEFSAYGSINFKESLFFATSATDIVNIKAPLGMTVIKYWKKGVRTKVQKSLSKFKSNSPGLTHASDLSNSLSCFGMLTSVDVEARNVVVIDDEYIIGEEYYEDDEEDDEDDDMINALMLSMLGP